MAKHKWATVNLPKRNLYKDLATVDLVMWYRSPYKAKLRESISITDILLCVRICLQNYSHTMDPWLVCQISVYIITIMLLSSPPSWYHETKHAAVLLLAFGAAVLF